MNRLHFKHWPPLLPKELVYPAVPLFEFLETSARRYPEKAAVIYYGRTIPYRELWEAVERFSAFLAGLGIKKGDRVALYLQNTPHYIIGYYGALRANAVAVPVNPMLTSAELKFLLNDNGSRFLITTSDLYPRVAEIKGETALEKVVVGDYGDYLPAEPSLPVPAAMAGAAVGYPDALNWPESLRTVLPAPPVEVGPDDLALLPYTAGSTGTPKGCLHTHATIIANTISSATWWTLTASGVCLATLPLFHVTGMIHSLHAPIYAGATIVLITRWDRETVLEAIQKYRCTHWTNITTMVVDLLNHPDLSRYDLSSLILVGGGGAPLPEAVGEKLYQVTGLRYIEGYGLTETISQTHMNPPHRPKLQCLGIPDFGVDARIVDPVTGEELPPGSEGEIVVSGPEVFKGYWNRPEDTEQAFLELAGKKFFRTGDIGRVDEDGYFFIIDRSKRMINAAGYKVWPTEIEGYLYRHPAIAEVCVVGVPDPVRVENVKAYVVLKPEYEGKVTAEEIIAWCKDKMAAYKYPRLVEFVSALPKSGAGKIMWRVLQEKERERAAGKSVPI